MDTRTYTDSEPAQPFLSDVTEKLSEPDQIFPNDVIENPPEPGQPFLNEVTENPPEPEQPFLNDVTENPPEPGQPFLNDITENLPEPGQPFLNDITENLPEPGQPFLNDITENLPEPGQPDLNDVTENLPEPFHLPSELQTCPPLDFLHLCVFPTLLPGLEALLREAQNQQCFKKRRTRFNARDFLTEWLYNKNPRRFNAAFINFEEIPFVKSWLLIHPRPPIPLSLLLSDDSAATLIQAFWRGYKVRCDPEVQELRQWQKELRDDSCNIKERIKEFWAMQELKVGKVVPKEREDSEDLVEEEVGKEIKDSEDLGEPSKFVEKEVGKAIEDSEDLGEPNRSAMKEVGREIEDSEDMGEPNRSVEKEIDKEIEDSEDMGEPNRSVINLEVMKTEPEAEASSRCREDED
ncbi:IQ domain-containing protein K isoform X5 [Erpetoichthys calabaricus]|uniref:IQ domain-containing protein K isoform X5 n=1 Tax=Erpetoichthys calabaricus TaxID=27687 RepID=UPI002233E9E5|nr:IQ domain-containing protein K isoform X5 [Erpetoichthys calabaricus]